MGKYAFEPDSSVKAFKARGSDLRIHFKSSREIVHTIKGMKLTAAKAYMKDVIAMKRAVPYTMFTGGIGRHAQLKNMKAPGSKGRWPVKATKVILDLLTNAEANAEKEGVEPEELVITHAMSNRAQKQRRRTYRAHGRINAYMASPAHVEIILTSAPEVVKKEADDEKKALKLTKRASAQLRIKAGGGD
jgi:large subunit ribosomal protein L17e